MYTIPIITNEGQINSAFVKANAEIITTYSEKFNQQSTVELKIQLLESLWKERHSAMLIKEDNTWSCISFLDAKSKTLFQLKWS
jgi:hypothetical protein